MKAYATILRFQRVRWLLVAGYLSRLPYGIESLATLFYVDGSTRSYTGAGAVSGAVVLGVAVGTVVHSRRLDRHGYRSLPALGVTHLAMLGLLAYVISARWTLPTMLVTGLAAGLTLPPLSSHIRALYPDALAEHGEPGQLVQAAFSLDSAMTEATYVTAPVLLALAMLLASAGVALLLAGTTTLAGIAIALLMAPVRVAAHPSPTRRFGALRAPGVLTLALASLPLGIAVGLLEVAISAFATEHGQPALGSLLIAAFSLACACGAVTSGQRLTHDGTSTASGRLRRLAWCYCPATAMVAMGTSPWLIGLLVVPLGLVNGTWVAARNYLTSVRATAGMLTESYAWVLTSVLFGISIGSLAGGVVVDRAGWQIAVLSAAVMAVAIALVVGGRRSTVEDESVAHPVAEPAGRC